MLVQRDQYQWSPDFYLNEFRPLPIFHSFLNNLQSFHVFVTDVPALISELHIFLLRRIKRNVPIDKWERELAKFCHSYNQWHAWEVEESGYAKLKLSTRLAIIRVSL